MTKNNYNSNYYHRFNRGWIFFIGFNK